MSQAQLGPAAAFDPSFAPSAAGAGTQGHDVSVLSSSDSSLPAPTPAAFAALSAQLRASNQARVRAEHASRVAEERVAQLAATHASTASISAARHQAQLAALRAEIAAKDALIAEDTARLESVSAAGDAAAAVKEARVLSQQLADARAAAAAAEHRARAAEAEAAECRRLAEAAQAAAAAAEAEGAAAGTTGFGFGGARAAELEKLLRMQAELDALTLERATASASASTAAAGGDGDGDGVEDGQSGAPLAVSVLSALESLRKAKTQQDAVIARLRADLAAATSASPRPGASASTAAGAAAAEESPAARAATTAALAEAETKIKALTEELTAMAMVVAATPATDAAAGTGAGAGAGAGMGAAVAEAAQAAAAARAAQAEAAGKDEALRRTESLLKKREEQLKMLKDNAHSKLTEASENIKRLRSEYTSLREAYQALKAQSEERVRRMHAQMVASRSQSAAARRRLLEQMAGHVLTLRGELAVVRADAASLSAVAAESVRAVVGEISARTGEQSKELALLREDYDREVRLRKKVFNQLQELKGNIRVYARARPLGDKERAEGGNVGVLTFPREGEIKVENGPKRQAFNFEFDHVFPPQTTQEEVFNEVQDLVTSVLDGYNVCIFAYGQTGSGKTHTMEGPRDNPGVNTRALDKLFTEAADKRGQWDYALRITLLEIYNEKVLDLLGESQEPAPLKVIQGKEGMEVVGLSHVEVRTADDVQRNLAKGKRNRHVARTDMNEHSSRSHLILSVYATGRNRTTGASATGKLHLIDLAGSERVSRSGVTGEALKEAQKINYSLSALGNVISARANKKEHIPYRNSALTYLLQDSLEKNSKTLMFVQLSPTLESVTETLCSLRFAERVRKVELGKAGKNVSSGAGSSSAAAASMAMTPVEEPDYDDDGGLSPFA